MTVHRETVPAALAGQRIDRVVAFVADVSRREAADLLDAGRVVVDGRVVERPSTRVEEGSEVVVEVDPASTGPAVRAEAAVEVPVVAVDEAFVVVDKPPGLVVHPGAGQATGTMAAGLLARFPELATVGDPERPGIVHRLDRDTSSTSSSAGRSSAPTWRSSPAIPMRPWAWSTPRSDARRGSRP